MIRCNSEADGTVRTKEEDKPGSGAMLWSRVFDEVKKMHQDEQYMQMALEEAVKGTGRVSPNPLVGAVIVKDGKVIAKGYHHYCGGLHAERDALSQCTEDLTGATMYVTLEPCCHTGRQPPCTEAIVGSGISRVVVGSGDPNPLVAGKGCRILREHGIEVTAYVLEEQCREMNTFFFHYITTGLPYVTMKYAMTADGKIATAAGLSKWITGEDARKRVHQDRNRYTAIMVGVGTVLADDPELTCRIEGGRNPVRIVCDTHLRTPLSSRLVQTADRVRTIICTSETDRDKQQPYLEAGCEMMELPEQDGHISVPSMMQQLGASEIDSVLLEGGGTLNWSVLQAGFVCSVPAYIAPKLFCGKAKAPIEGTGVAAPDEAFILYDKKIHTFGEDIMIEGKVKNHVYGNC